MKPLPACLPIVLLFTSVAPRSGTSPRPAVPATKTYQSGWIDAPEVSGASMVGDRLLIASDDPYPKNSTNMIALLDDVRHKVSLNETLSKGRQIYPELLKKLKVEDPEFVADLEDLAQDAKGNVFAISSHSRSNSKDQPARPRRCRLIRMRFNPKSGHLLDDPVSIELDLLARLPASLKGSADRQPGSEDPATGVPTPGFNVEGLACTPQGDLLLGLRSPNLAGQAIVLRLRGKGLTSKKEAPIAVTEASRLDLGGLGIRGMCADPKRNGYWIIAGLSPDPKVDPAPQTDWSLWFWDGKRKLRQLLKRSSLPPEHELSNPEAVCILDAKASGERRLLLVSDDGDKAAPGQVRPMSRYVALPVPK